MRLLAFLAMMLAFSPVLAQRPELSLDQGRWLVVERLPPVLEEEGLHDQLRTGLTTSLAFHLVPSRRRSAEPIGGARVEVRYELWDEVYGLTVIEMDGQVRRETVESAAELAHWWSQLKLRILDLQRIEQIPQEQLRLYLQVVPFSRAEQAETQRWLSDLSFRDPRRSEQGSGVLEGGKDPLEKVFSVLIATSIQRRPLVEFEWTVSWPERP